MALRIFPAGAALFDYLLPFLPPFWEMALFKAQIGPNVAFLANGEITLLFCTSTLDAVLGEWCLGYKFHFRASANDA